MSNARLLAILGLLLALALSLSGPQLAQASEAAKGEPLYWVAPMDPNYRRPGPGKSPMGMDLVPVFEAPESSGVVTVSAERQQAFGVRLAAVSEGPLESTLRGSVVVSLPDQARWDLVLREDSWILNRWVASAGQRVTRGAPLFEVDVPAWAQDQDAWLAAKAAGDEQLQAAAAQRLQRQGFPEDAFLVLKSDGEIQNPLVLRAPETGQVTAISANAGAFRKAGTPLLSLTGDEGLWLEIFFTAGAPAKLSAGSEVNIFLPGRDPFPVSLTWIDQTLTADARALRGRATVTEANALALGLRSGETGTAQLRWASAGAIKRIPLSAILPGLNGEPDRVLKAIGNDRFRPTPVHLGVRGRRYAEVLHGLALGDQVVAQGTFLLEAEANRAAELARLTPEDDHSTMDHSTMDHSTMDHSTMDHSTMDHSTMDHSTMDLGE
ncbi:MAG: efflux RND transporter periplasmic adaptor subunit, partial [Pseudomonadales bacterium]|nr:efflux RND transporter periplasmic adaptor subunit [Pseudomonadales bacterium]